MGFGPGLCAIAANRLAGDDCWAEQESTLYNTSTIIKMGDWLLDNLPAIGEALGSLFALPAIGRVVGKAGEAAVRWVTQRFESK